jgi:hypothetical protein
MYIAASAFLKRSSIHKESFGYVIHPTANVMGNFTPSYSKGDALILLTVLFNN